MNEVPLSCATHAGSLDQSRVATVTVASQSTRPGCSESSSAWTQRVCPLSDLLLKGNVPSLLLGGINYHPWGRLDCLHLYCSFTVSSVNHSSGFKAVRKPLNTVWLSTEFFFLQNSSSAQILPQTCLFLCFIFELFPLGCPLT